jgi:predicted SAM-dependent methyltransferase
VDTVLDIGAGIAPMRFFTPKLYHIILEPFIEYVQILRYKYQHNNKYLVIHIGNTIEYLKCFGDRSIDSIFMLDVIEHMSKEDGLLVIKECERIAKNQVVIFTPLGFAKQDCENDDRDPWGLSGVKVQQHRSGWTLQDFDKSYDFFIAEKYHSTNWKGEKVEEFGSFYAIKNQNTSEISKPECLKNIYDEFRYLADIDASIIMDPNIILSELERLNKAKSKDLSFRRLKKNIKREYGKIKIAFSQFFKN